MSEPKLISPLLDGFVMGAAISNHDGVRCYPAMKENSDEKFIVKAISVPASQVQLDALLLTGAYKDPADATDYFKEVADNVAKEAETLKTIAKLEGFLSYDCWQIVPMEDGRLGYEIYLLGSYKRSLEKYVRRNGMTHLEAINLGLDLCQAMAICRRSGYMYVDLKPSNIFISKEKGYRIGDLGFVALDSLQFTSLPAKYRSPYNPPEVHDDLNTLNPTVDTYGIGMLLYQIYNDSSLPHTPSDPKEAFPSPSNADYEIAEIIMKAVSPDPQERWQDPMEMGQALVAYMQRNSVNNIPIAAPRLNLTDADTIVLPNVKELTVNAQDTPVDDETTPGEEETALISDSETSQDIGRTVSQADLLLSQEVPENVVVPESLETPVPKSDQTDTVDAESKNEDDELDQILKEVSSDLFPKSKTEKTEASVSNARKNTVAVKEPKPKEPLSKGVIATVVVLIIICLLCGCAFFFYQSYYLQTIDELLVDGTQNQLTVTVRSGTDESLLSVRCVDSYGNGVTQSVVNGQAVFTDLLPDSLYRIELQIDGSHKLVGQTSEIFTTDAMTNVVTFSSVIGPEDGSVLLNFTVDGPEPSEWIVSCSAEGEETVSQNFVGHTVTVRDLTVGKLYTFTLSSADGLEVMGQNSLEYQVSRIVTAEELTIISCINGELTVQWQAPEDVTVEKWSVRCYDDNGYESIAEVTESKASFSGIDSTAAYTVEVTAAGMTQPTRTSITANPITVTGMTFDESDLSKLTVNWTHEGASPEGGWYMMYSIDDSVIQNIVKSETSSASIEPRIHGATYHFEIQAADGTSIFNNRGEYTCPNVDVYQNHGLSAEKITSYLLKTPEGEWTYDQLGNDVFTDQFAVGDNISMVLKASINFYLDNEDLEVLYVIRDEQGNVLPECISQETLEWNALWFAGDYHASELDIPKVPDQAGNYSISVYFNNAAVTTTTFSITE